MEQIKTTKRYSSNFDLLPWQRHLGCKNFKLLLLFCFSMESSHFWPLVLRDPFYKTLFFDFWFRPPDPQNWLPKIWPKIAYNSACMADRPEMFAPNRGFSGTADWMEPYKMLSGRPLLPWQRKFCKFGLLFHKNRFFFFVCWWNRAIFRPSVLHVALYKTLFLIRLLI